MCLLTMWCIERALYWVDGERIECSDLDGDNRRVIYSNGGDSFVSIALGQHYIFVTDSSKRSVLELAYIRDSTRLLSYHVSYTCQSNNVSFNYFSISNRF